MHEDHGHSVAAWTSVGIILLGATVMSVAIVFANVPFAIVGGGIVVLGMVAGKVLAMAGYGAKSHDRERPVTIADAPDEQGTATVGKS